MLLPTRAKPTALVWGGLRQRRGAASVYRPRGVTALGCDALGRATNSPLPGGDGLVKAFFW